ncbi:hypothetical protein [Patulibacter defluvii]|uniref:hypothetical protein n=1 Tax=Patulibacter defluvii TaxID=3095358 RepID=UPI002A759ECE|nr:hypothetical protein [Patulibacter sp. DM4]
MWSPRTLALVTAAALAVTGCGGDDGDQYATAWNDTCREVSDAYRSFQTAVATAADTSPDRGDAAARSPVPAAAVAADLRKPAQELGAALEKPLGRIRDTDPPQRYAAWHRQAVRRLDAQLRVLDDGVDRLARGDGDALAQLALGGVGPAAADAPTGLRDETPDCTSMR